MLPLLNLTSSEALLPDALPGAGSLVPEANDALLGGFATVLQSTVRPAVLLQAPAGEDLPVSGNALPLAIPADEPQLNTDLDEPVAAIDLSTLGLPQPRTARDTEPALPVNLPEEAPGRGETTPADVDLPVTTHVPPPLEVTGTVAHEIRVSSSETAGDDGADALQVPLATPAVATERPGARSAARDRASDTEALRPRSLVVAHEPAGRPAHALPVHGIDVAVATRPDAGFDDRAPQRIQSRVPRPDASADSRTIAASTLARDEAPRAVHDDGLPLPRPVQATAWQPGAVTVDVAAESGPRMHADSAAAMPRVAAAQTVQIPPPLPPAAQTMDIPVQQPGWDIALADRVTMMANGRLQNAELRLTPAELGPLRIQLDIDDGVANVSFQSQHPVTREALEQAMPRLRELLAENGLSLGQADVRDDSSQQKSREMLADARTASAARSDNGESDDTTPTLRRVTDSLVDTFA